jgi:hypothetical protein
MLDSWPVSAQRLWDPLPDVCKIWVKALSYSELKRFERRGGRYINQSDDIFDDARKLFPSAYDGPLICLQSRRKWVPSHNLKSFEHKWYVYLPCRYYEHAEICEDLTDWRAVICCRLVGQADEQYLRRLRLQAREEVMPAEETSQNLSVWRLDMELPHP